MQELKKLESETKSDLTPYRDITDVNAAPIISSNIWIFCEKSTREQSDLIKKKRFSAFSKKLDIYLTIIIIILGKTLPSMTGIIF